MSVPELSCVAGMNIKYITKKTLVKRNYGIPMWVVITEVQFLVLHLLSMSRSSTIWPPCIRLRHCYISLHHEQPIHIVVLQKLPFTTSVLSCKLTQSMFEHFYKKWESNLKGQSNHKSSPLSSTPVFSPLGLLMSLHTRIFLRVPSQPGYGSSYSLIPLY